MIFFNMHIPYKQSPKADFKEDFRFKELSIKPSFYNKTVLKVYFTVCFRENLHLILQIIVNLMKGHFL